MSREPRILRAATPTIVGTPAIVRGPGGRGPYLVLRAYCPHCRPIHRHGWRPEWPAHATPRPWEATTMDDATTTDDGLVPAQRAAPGREAGVPTGRLAVVELRAEVAELRAELAKLLHIQTLQAEVSARMSANLGLLMERLRAASGDAP